MLGEILGDRYQILQQLGRRAGQPTFLAWDGETMTSVVVKLLKFGADLEWEHFKLFEREAQTLQQLDHPSIPQYLDYFHVDLPDCRGFALVQTYIEAPSLATQFQAGRSFDETEVQEIGEQLLSILTYLHQQTPPVIHRDIKPSNVLLQNRSAHSVGQVSLVDFGSVQNLVATEGGTITVVGTYGYMPPEQFGGRAVPASDLYGLGTTLIYLLTGVHPAELPQKDLRLQFTDCVTLTPSFSHWLQYLVEPSLDRRCPSAQDAIDALQQPQAIALSGKYQRPAGSKIRLYKDEYEKFSLFIGQPRWGWKLSRPPLTSWGCLIALMLWFVWAGWLVFSLAWDLATYIISLMMTRCISITPHSINQVELLFGQVVSSQSSPRDYITKIEVVTERVQASQWGPTKQPAEILIWAGTTAYRLNRRGGLTPPEVDWLSQELGDCLDIEIEWRNVPYVQNQK